MVRIVSKLSLVTVVFFICTGLSNIHATETPFFYIEHITIEAFAGSMVDSTTVNQDATDYGTIDNAEQGRLIEKYTRWFIIIILILSLITVILAFSKFFAQRKANRILTHQRNILKNTLIEQRINEEKYKALFSQANDAIFLMDNETFIDCNDKTLEMFGCQREEIIGQPPYKFSPPIQPDGKKSKERAILLIEQCNKGAPQRFYWMHSKLDGTLFDAEVSLNMIRLEGEYFIQAIVRNISEQVRAEREMVRAREKAEKATESKTFFLAKMSHEIRTMLGGITSSTQLLMNTKVNKNQSELLDIIDISADNLLTIVNEILDLSKIEAGKIDIEDHPFNISKTLEEIINAYLPEAKKKDISLYLSIHHKLPEYISGDELRLKQILANLLSNALKFTNKGSVKLDVTIASEDEQTCTIAFKIIDTGIGIPENKIKDMFAEYSQSDVSISRRFGGTGLGLNIVYKLMNLMNGTIDVQSKLNKGTQFTVQILFNKTDFAGTKKEQKETTPLKSTEKYKVLLAEDNVINQKITLINLEQLGHDVDLAVNGKEAWEKYQQKEYDIILMDIQMPEMDGIEVTHLIRKYEADHPAKRKTRIIALTANILGQDADYCLSEGMDEYIPKPFRIEDILKKLEPKNPSGK